MIPVTGSADSSSLSIGTWWPILVAGRRRTRGRGTNRRRCWRCVRCPHGARSDRKRTRAVLARLRAQEAGKLLLAELGRDLVICYGDVREGVLQDDGALVLQRDRSAPANAARLGHLLHHLVRRLPFDETAARGGTLACSEIVKSAAEGERTAHQLESELRRTFGLPPLPFEDLSEEYRRRCQALRSEPPSPAPK